MEDKNFTIIEDIFDTDTQNNGSLNDLNYNREISQSFNRNKRDTSFLRTLDNNSARTPYPMGSIASLSYDEDMIKNKLSRQINPRSLASQYNSMSTSNRILQPPSNVKLNELPNSNMQVRPVIPPPHDNSMYHITCRNIYDHVENCPFCQKYYKQSNRTYILIIVFLVLIILLLLRQNNN